MNLLIALLPVILMLIAVIVTKKTAFSLGVGILLACIITLTSNTATLPEILLSFWETTLGNIEIIAFLVILGVVTSIVTAAGGTAAFGRLIGSTVKSTKTALYIPFISGILVFIDDYFNALIVGEISKPITDQQKVSRAKLSYIIDSTAAPIVVLIPLSTWSIYIMGLLQETGYSGTELLMASWPYLFYPLAALIMVFLVITFSINIGSMASYEEDAANGNDTSMQKSLTHHNDLSVESNGKAITLIIPLITLLLGSFGFMFLEIFTSPDISSILDTNMVRALVVGSVLSLAMVTFLVFMQKLDIRSYKQAALLGLEESLPTIIILVLAFNTATAFDFLNLSGHIGAILDQSSISNTLLPVIVFLVTGGIAFATGSSWGAYAILIPTIIGSLLVVNSDTALVSMTTAAIISGGVWGDHCSPISDTTILSSSGSNCKLDAHFESQLPYSIIIGVIASISFLLSGITGSFIVPLLFIFAALVGIVVIYRLVLEKRV